MIRPQSRSFPPYHPVKRKPEATPEIIIDPIDHFSDEQISTFSNFGDVIRHSVSRHFVDGSFGSHLLGLLGVEKLQNIGNVEAMAIGSRMLNGRLSSVRVQLDRSRLSKRTDIESEFVKKLTYPSEFRVGFTELDSYNSAIMANPVGETFESCYAPVINDPAQFPRDWSPFDKHLAAVKPQLDRLALRASVGYALRVVLEHTKPKQ